MPSQQLNAIIVEDEYHSRQTLQLLLQKFHPDINILAMAEDVPSALVLIKQHQPNLLFLDIELKLQSAFDLLRQIDSSNMHIIFTTAFEQYAIQAIKHAAIDYLLKPIIIEELNEAINKVQQAANKQINMHQTIPNSYR